MSDFVLLEILHSLGGLWYSRHAALCPCALAAAGGEHASLPKKRKGLNSDRLAGTQWAGQDSVVAQSRGNKVFH